MNLRTVDLNLLVVFDRLMRARSVNGAAAELSLTPSAVSHALARLRALFNDELLVRGPDGFHPTRRALDLHSNLGDTLQRIERAIGDLTGFEPAASAREFKLHLSDYVGGLLLPPLCARLRAIAPAVKLVVERHFSVTERPDPDALQVRVGWMPHLAGYQHEVLLDDAYVVVMRDDHPAAAAELDAAGYAALAHVRVSPAALGTSAIDDALAKRALTRDVAFTVANWLEAVRIVERTDLVAAVPRPWLALEDRLNRLAQRPLPLPEVRFVVEHGWHPGKDLDAGHRWFREQVKRVFDDRAWSAGAPARSSGAGAASARPPAPGLPSAG
ncbi:MAG: LysR family transcriptional regulator [Lautropia sp.]